MLMDRHGRLYAMSSLQGGACCVMCRIVCNEKHPTSITLALEDPGMRPGLKVFWLLPRTFHLFPSCLSLLVSTSSLSCIFSFSQNVGVEAD